MKKSMWVKVLWFFITLSAVLLYARLCQSIPSVSPSTATPFSAPAFSRVETLNLTLANDPTDVYLPTDPALEAEPSTLPIALLLSGALVGRAQYSQFASRVAQAGFVVVVPTHIRSIPDFGVTGELAEVSQVTNVLNAMTAENTNPASPLAGKLDVSHLALLGHSHGGYVGLQAIANTCTVPFCTAPFNRPDALVAGVFYGVNSYNPMTQEFGATNNASIPVALIQGSRDGIATPAEATATYELIQTPPKAIITIEGTNHYGITNQNNPSGAKPDDSVPTLEQEQGIESIAQWTGYFLRAHVMQDAMALNHIYQYGTPVDTIGVDAIVTVKSQLTP